ncbi:DNA-processing protein DprA [Cobetia marina]|uniref:DNA-processing protein DprA n=1 Tax=Cobetia marina TaxID=28258 RepID=UPI001169B8B2|nr:DNA-processing protein DprA [Cobetia marina]GED42017.1 DNA processing protein DprA [Cobetia marina]
MSIDGDVEQRRPSRADFVFLARLPGIGTHTVAKLLERADWPQGWLAALPSRLAAPVRLWCERPASSPLHQQVMTDLAWHAPEQGRHLLTPADADWPAMLALLPDPPIALWALGRRSLLEQPMLAIVGARKASPAGMTHAHDLSAELVSRGWSVASGLALGIDAAAHQGALNAALRLEADAYPAPPSTLAVLGCGVDVTYPAQHHQLRLRLLESGGLLLSEHPPGTGAHARHFPRRNRLITGLSHGVLVVEATLRSGSLVSARLAMEQNREVFALPGRIDDIASSGCLELIRQGATLVRDVDDMLAELSHLMPTEQRRPLASPRGVVDSPSTPRVSSSRSVPTGARGNALPENLPLLEGDRPVAETSPVPAPLCYLSAMPLALDQLVELSGTHVSVLSMQLLELELEGRVVQAPGGWKRL